MALNRKLTPVISGRTIRSAEQDGCLLNLVFTDGSQMRIKTGGAPPLDTLPGHPIKAVRQSGTRFNLDFLDGSTARITLAEATSSVMLRDAAGNLEYAD